MSQFLRCAGSPGLVLQPDSILSLCHQVLKRREGYPLLLRKLLRPFTHEQDVRALQHLPCQRDRILDQLDTGYRPNAQRIPLHDPRIQFDVAIAGQASPRTHINTGITPDTHTPLFTRTRQSPTRLQNIPSHQRSFPATLLSALNTFRVNIPRSSLNNNGNWHTQSLLTSSLRALYHEDGTQGDPDHATIGINLRRESGIP